MTFDGVNRVETYDNLSWVRDSDYAQVLLKVCCPYSYETICDVGTGTGYVASIIAPFCNSVHAVDNDVHMLDAAKKKILLYNVQYKLLDIEKDKLPQSYNSIVARMSLHHIPNDEAAINHCIDALMHDGKFIVAEGIPPEGTLDFYTEMFRLKEIRNVYTLDILLSKLKRCKIEDIVIHTQKNMSIKNWLENSCEDTGARESIFKMHLDAPSYIKKAYNMKLTTNGDILMDWRSVVIRAVRR